jgi:hypothetical protein
VRRTLLAFASNWVLQPPRTHLEQVSQAIFGGEGHVAELVSF